MDGTDPFWTFLLVLRWTDDIPPPPPTSQWMVQRFLLQGSFPPCWRLVNVTSKSKSPSSSSVANNRPISKTPCCLKCLSIWCQFESDNWLNAVVYFKSPNCLSKGLGTCDAPLHVVVRVPVVGPSTGFCCSTHRELRSLISVGSHFDGSCRSKLVFVRKFYLNIKLIGIQFGVQCMICPV